MEYVLLIYLNDILLGVESVAFASALLSGCWLVFVAIVWFHDDIHSVDYKPQRKVAIRVLAISMVVGILIPSEDSRKLMLAVYIGDQIVNTEEFQETTGKAYDLLQEWLDEALEEEK